mmetsp:Transcript_29635/g.45410  ORF Transcript_29635/g.45410 Transcript_29635/m.45410 type:complete len:86 (-) Transcript_29635:37-294(-)
MGEKALSSWDTSNGITFDVMFTGAKSFIGDLSTWDTNSDKGMNNMFHDASSFNRDLKVGQFQGNVWDINIYSLRPLLLNKLRFFG